MPIGMPLPLKTCPDVGVENEIGGPELSTVAVELFSTVEPLVKVATTLRLIVPFG